MLEKKGIIQGYKAENGTAVLTQNHLPDFYGLPQGGHTAEPFPYPSPIPLSPASAPH